MNDIKENKGTNILENKWGIKDNDRYNIVFKSEDNKNIFDIKRGKILNFCPSQVIVKTDKGLYIIEPMNIIEMRPLLKRKSIPKLIGYEILREGMKSIF